MRTDKRLERFRKVRASTAAHIREDLLPCTVAEAALHTGLSRTTIQRIGHEFRIEFDQFIGKGGRRWRPRQSDAPSNKHLSRAWR